MSLGALQGRGVPPADLAALQRESLQHLLEAGLLSATFPFCLFSREKEGGGLF